MRAVVSSKGVVSVEERPEPSGEGELIRVTSSGICGSDLHLVKMGLSGVILGHEFGGRSSDGSLFAVRPTGECGACASCRRGHPNTCASAAASLHGTSIDGGLADLVRVDHSRLVSVPSTVDPATVGLVEPLAVVVHGINRVSPQEGCRSLVVGAGSIGLLTAAVLHDRGIEVDILARHPHQAAAAEALGARVLSTPADDYDVTFDAVCTQETFNTCVSATKPRGTLVEFGMVWSPVSLNNTFMLKEITIVPSIFYGHDHAHDDFAEAVDVLARQPHIVESLVTHRYPLQEAARAFDVAADKSSGAIKVHLSFD